MVQATNHHPAVGPLSQVDACLLKVGYADIGLTNGRVAVLPHGWPYDIPCYLEVAPMLAAAGYRAVLAGFDWGARTAAIVAALWPDRCRVGSDHYRRDFAKLIWRTASPKWALDDATFDRSAAAFDNPDHVQIVITTTAGGSTWPTASPDYQELEEQLAGGAGHNLPQEAPEAFATAVLEVDPA
jgi:pimeloyl-ACP methyl ester carboxylesterase